MVNVLAALSHVQEVMSAQSLTIMTVLGVLFTISKAISTQKAPVIVGKIQGFFDSLAQILVKAGEVVQAFSNALASLVKSDGVLGNK